MPLLRTLFQIEAREPSTLRDNSCNSCLSSGESSPSGPCLDFIASDDSLDRYDEVISASGWRLDTYRRNPVFQNAHQYGDILFTLGKALITEVRSVAGSPCERSTPHSALRDPHLFQRVQFATDVNPIARIAYGLYQGKFLNAVSVGFIPLRWVDANGVEHTAPSVSAPEGAGRGGLVSSSLDVQPRQNEAGTAQRSTRCRRKYLEQELLEVSAVGIPANPNALALALKSGAIEKSDLRETLALLRGAISPRTGFVEPRRGVGARELLFLARELHRILRRA
jgi:hypothetical protein